jgi:Domain of unknown function (DUF4105)
MAEPTSAADADRHARCRFPARAAWLREKFGDAAFPGPEVRCPEFDAWTRQGSVHSVSIVFATGFLGNPASYYGHTLLKFNFPEEGGHTDLMDVSVNYGAILEGKHDGMATYLAKSLFGGYDGGFSHIHFYYHDHNYGDQELRDLWEYRLDLPPEAVARLVAHAWEVLGKRYSYYFFRGNCVSRMVELLQTVDGFELERDARPWEIPQSFIRALSVARFRGRPVVGEILYHPSRQSRFYGKYAALSRDETRLLEQIVSRRTTLADPAYASLPIASKQRIIEALMDYWQFVGTPIAEAPPRVREGYGEALAARYALPPGQEASTPMPASPDQGRPAAWTQLGIGHHETHGRMATLRIRPAYYDALDGASGNVKFGALTMADTELRFYRDTVRLQNLDIVRVDSVGSARSGLPGDNGSAWKLAAGLTQARQTCDRCLVARLAGDVGASRLFGGVVLVAGYAGGALQNNRDSQGTGFTHLAGDLIARLDDGLAARFSYERRVPFGTHTKHYDVTAAEARMPVGRRADVRVRFERDGARTFSVGAGAYW